MNAALQSKLGDGLDQGGESLLALRGDLENQWVRFYPAPLQQQADYLKVIPDAAKQAYDRGHAYALGMIHLQIGEGLHIWRNQFGVGILGSAEAC